MRPQPKGADYTGVNSTFPAVFSTVIASKALLHSVMGNLWVMIGATRTAPEEIRPIALS